MQLNWTNDQKYIMKPNELRSVVKKYSSFRLKEITCLSSCNTTPRFSDWLWALLQITRTSLNTVLLDTLIYTVGCIAKYLETAWWRFFLTPENRRECSYTKLYSNRKTPKSRWITRNDWCTFLQLAICCFYGALALLSARSRRNMSLQLKIVQLPDLSDGRRQLQNSFCQVHK